jgi:hypothetical protein
MANDLPEMVGDLLFLVKNPGFVQNVQLMEALGRDIAQRPYRPKSLPKI